jgi:hypothetical protein
MHLQPADLPPCTSARVRAGEGPDRSGSVSEICSWASQLAAESRDRDTVLKSYVWPKSLIGISELLDGMRGGLVGIVGLQGVGKTTSLMMLDATERMKGERGQVVFFKWRRERELFKSLLDRNHEASEEFLQEYGGSLAKVLKQTEQDVDGAALDSLLQRKVGKSTVERFRKTAWMHFLRTKRLILIDTPDYSKTDRRAMATDLADIYWLWNNFTRTCEAGPNMVVAVQKEMFGGHFFFDKMHKIELEPLEPSVMQEAFVKRFNGTWPFSEDALIVLARMSRGIFRRFQRYIMLTVKAWQIGSSGQGSIDVATVKEAVTPERLAEDMELELSEVYPKHRDLRLQAVRALIHLEESGPITQERLAEQLEVERYAMSRLLSKLELHKYVVRERVGSEKVVRLTRH